MGRLSSMKMEIDSATSSDKKKITIKLYAISRVLRLYRRSSLSLLLLSEVSEAIIKSMAHPNTCGVTVREVLRHIKKAGFDGDVIVQYECDNRISIVETIRSKARTDVLYSLISYTWTFLIAFLIVLFHIQSPILFILCKILCVFSAAILVKSLVIEARETFGERHSVFLCSIAFTFLLSVIIAWLWVYLKNTQPRLRKTSELLMLIAIFSLAFSKLSKKMVNIGFFLVSSLTFSPIEVLIYLPLEYTILGSYFPSISFYSIVVLILLTDVYLSEIEVSGEQRIVCEFLKELKKNLRKENLHAPPSLAKELDKEFRIDPRSLEDRFNKTIDIICEK